MRGTAPFSVLPHGEVVSFGSEVRAREKIFRLAPDTIVYKPLRRLLDAVQLLTFKGKLRVDKLSGSLTHSSMGGNHNENNVDR
jgi:hypothetical protein